MLRHLQYIGFILAVVAGFPSLGLARSGSPEYLLFHLFIGGVNPNGVYSQSLSLNDMEGLVQTISSTVRPASSVPNRILGFDVGPISMDQGAVGAINAINQAFAVATAANMAVASISTTRMLTRSRDLRCWPLAAGPSLRGNAACMG